MTEKQWVVKECANWLPDGTCLGIKIRDDLSQVVTEQAGKRCLVVQGERCEYFDACVVPAIKKGEK